MTITAEKGLFTKLWLVERLQLVQKLESVVLNRLNIFWNVFFTNSASNFIRLFRNDFYEIHVRQNLRKRSRFFKNNL